MKLKKIIILLSGLALFGFSAGPAYAIEGKTTGIENRVNAIGTIKPTVAALITEKAEARVTKVMTRLQTNATNEINRRLASLNKLILKINTVIRLTADQKTTLIAQVQTEIDSLNLLLTKIKTDTSPADLAADKKSIVDTYRIFALFIPKMQVIISANRTLDVANNYKAISTKLAARIATAKTAGQDVTAAQADLDDANAKIADAITLANNAIITVTPLAPAGWPGNKTTLETARKMLALSHQDLARANNDFKKIAQILKSFTKPTPKPTATPTP